MFSNSFLKVNMNHQTTPASNERRRADDMKNRADSLEIEVSQLKSEVLRLKHCLHRANDVHASSEYEYA